MAALGPVARGFGGFHRQLARGLLDEQIEDPEPFVARPGFLGWLQSSLRDRTGWRSMAYLAVKVPLAALGILVGFACWWDAFFCLTYPVWGGSGNGVPVFGLPRSSSGRGFFSAAERVPPRARRRSAPAWSSSSWPPGPCGPWCTSTAGSCGCCSRPMP